MLMGDTTRLYEGDLRRLTMIIRAAITFFGVLLLAVIAFAGWSANKSATDAERTLVENALNQSIANLLDGQKSVAWWDDAVIKITDESIDLQFADDEFGIFLTETYGHDETYILNARDEPIWAYKEGARAGAEAYAERRAALLRSSPRRVTTPRARGSGTVRTNSGARKRPTAFYRVP